MEAAVSSHMVHPNIVATYIVHTGEVSTAALAVTGRHGRQQDRMKLVTLLVQVRPSTIGFHCGPLGTIALGAARRSPQIIAKTLPIRWCSRCQIDC
jgi:hypothetical protein